MPTKKYQIPEALIQFLRLVELSRKDGAKQGQNVPYKVLSVVLGKEDGKEKAASGFLVTEGMRMLDELGTENQGHQRTHWFLESFEDASSRHAQS
jgi:hypothetical protein